MSFGLVKEGGGQRIGIDLELTTHNPEVAAQLKAECEAAVKVLDGIERAMVQVKMPPAGQAPAGGAGQAQQDSRHQQGDRRGLRQRRRRAPAGKPRLRARQPVPKWACSIATSTAPACR